MGLIRGLIGGMIGGAIGIAIWVAVGHFANYEVGWIAWGVGFLVGVGVRYAAFLGGEDESFGFGLLSAAMAIGALVLAKYILYLLVLINFSSELEADFAKHGIASDESMIAMTADELIEEIEDRGGRVRWPLGKSAETAERPSDYPPDIWRQAKEKWFAVDAEVRDKKKAELRKQLVGILQSLRPEFASFFSPWDLLWFGLATFTAFRVGDGSYGED